MFRDLKEYQTLQKIYEEQIVKNPHEDLIIKAFQSEEFTVEEIDYVVKNIDQLCDENLLREENNDLNEAIGKVVKTVVQKTAPKLVNTAQKASKAVASGVKAGADKATPAVKNVASSATKKFGSALGKVKAGLSRAGQAVSSQVSKAKPLLKKGLETAKKVVPAAAAIGGAVAATKAIKNRLNKNKDTSSEIESSEAEFKANEGGKFNQAMKNKMSSSSGSTRPTAQDLAKQRIGSGTAKNPDTTIAQANQRNRDAMRDRARARNAAFQKKREEFRQNRKAGISNSKPQEKVKSPMDMRGESYDAYDVVLEYLLTSQQAATIEEANYIMTEMDAKTIQDIVSQQLNEQN